MLLENEDFGDGKGALAAIQHFSRMLGAKAGAAPRFDIWFTDVIAVESQIELTAANRQKYTIKGYIQDPANGRVTRILIEGDAE